MSKIEFCNLLKDVEYENGSGDRRALNVSWHPELDVLNISFYDRDADYLAFAEDFDLPTAIELRKRLNRIIKAVKNELLLKTNEPNEKKSLPILSNENQLVM